MAFGPLDDVPSSSVRHRVAKIPVPSSGCLFCFQAPALPTVLVARNK